jgi:hypothetical protein
MKYDLPEVAARKNVCQVFQGFDAADVKSLMKP